eukprot:CAMPEP_0171069730 /NCGR_PEP_ID=MMETSP0766_2-20121228/9331_1 /TAXON_ID=439317 /ORGANISM="Gambierdiscus australes, Strain CAWD 149" /LENGTH=509 /DNA_ID=CAMNT_0011526145 /DNA_START=56 /DNA_END=1581 /DNA_ORIENTATION=+
MLANTLQTLGLKGQRSKTGTATTTDEEARPLGGASARRRLLQVSQLAVRGLDLTNVAAGYFLEVTADGTSEALERSDVFQTQNPTWVLVCSMCRGKNLSVFEIRAIDAQSHHTFWNGAVDLQEFAPFCEDLEDLRQIPPLGVPLVRLGRHWFSSSACLSAAGISIGAPVSSEVRRRNASVKHIKASEICTAGDRISTMLENMHKLEAKSSASREAMKQWLAKGREICEQRARRLASEQRVQQLRCRVADRRQDIEQLRAQLGLVRGRLAATQPQFRSRPWLQGALEKQRQSASSLRDVRRSLQALWQQLRCRQMRMLHDVRQVYPIEKRERCWIIRGLCVAGIDILSHQDLREEENVSTALGFLAHFLVTLASILQVPLRIGIQQAGCSRSYVSDPHESLDSSTLPREFPLYYGRGLEKSRFETALWLLRDGLHQFLYSRGYFDERRLSSCSLLECAELILQKEMYGAELSPQPCASPRSESNGTTSSGLAALHASSRTVAFSLFSLFS